MEEQKLRLTVDHQLASQQALDDPDDELLERNAEGIKKKLTELAQEIRLKFLLPLKFRESLRAFFHFSETIEEMRYRVDDILENEPNATEHASPEK